MHDQILLNHNPSLKIVAKGACVKLGGRNASIYFKILNYKTNLEK